MATKRYQLDSYRKALLNRVTANAAFTEYIENTLAREDESAKHSFHKVMIHNWGGTDVQLFDIISEYFTSTIIPVLYSSQSDITSFYTSSLSLILKMIRLDFMFPFQRNMFNIDILFNDKTSLDCFHNTITLEDVVCSVVSGRFSEKCELDLSNFCHDPEFEDKKIHFYKLSLLAYFKILMLRMGRDTKSLNLSNNELSQVPLDILNFFIKGDLTEINFSNNQLPSLNELLRVSSKIEKLWLEGNPLCEQLDPVSYVKVISMKFPRLIELDGVRINEHGCVFPFFKNYLVTPDRKTKMIVEKFLTLYFTHYDCPPRRRLAPMYAKDARLSLTTGFKESNEREYRAYAYRSHNMLPGRPREWMMKPRWFHNSQLPFYLPPAEHDPASFTVDVLLHTNKAMIVVVDGIFRGPASTEAKDANPPLPRTQYFSFRRTFVFTIKAKRVSSTYLIQHDMWTIREATEEQIANSFKHPIRNLNKFQLVNPDLDDIEAIVKAFVHITGLRRFEAESRLKLQNWDMKAALKFFMQEYRENKVSPDKMVEDDDFSDTSSLVDEID